MSISEQNLHRILCAHSLECDHSSVRTITDTTTFYAIIYQANTDRGFRGISEIPVKTLSLSRRNICLFLCSFIPSLHSSSVYLEAETLHEEAADAVRPAFGLLSAASLARACVAIVLWLVLAVEGSVIGLHIAGVAGPVSAGALDRRGSQHVHAAVLVQRLRGTGALGQTAAF